MTELTNLLVQKDDAWSMPDNVHTAIIGASGSGKTGGLLVAIKKALKNRRRGLVITDAEGELTPHVLEYLANPCHGVSDRRVHLLDAKPNSHAFGIGLLDTKTPGDPQSAHDAASRTVAVFESVMSFGAPEYGPRLQKELNLGCSVLALTGRPLVCLPEIFTLSAEQARATLGETFTYQFMRSEWQALNVLGQKNPRAFIDYTDPVLSRSINLFGSPNLRRIFGQRQQYNFDVRQALENRDIIILNLGGLEHKDSVLIGTAFFSKIYHTALELPITNEPVATVICEECSDYLTADTARGLDRLRKRGIFLVLCLQRCAQLSKANDPAATLLSAVLTNCRAKIIFGGLVADDAELITRVLFTGSFKLDTIYKEGSKRPVAVGVDKVKLSSAAEARHHAHQQSQQFADSRSAGRVHGLSDGTATNFSMTTFSGAGAGTSSLPDASLLSAPSPISHSLSSSSGRGGGLAYGRSQARIYAEQSSRSSIEGSAYGTADGVSRMLGSHEAFVARYQELCTEAYSLEEKMHALTGLIMNMPPRTCLLKTGSSAPVLSRTPDLKPNFKSEALKQKIMPLYMKRLLRNPYLRPVEVVDAEIAADIESLTQPVAAPMADPAAAEPLPIIGEPLRYAREFWKRRREAGDPAASRGSRPVLRVIDGNADGGDNENP